MKDQVLQRMDELGCEPALRRLVERLPDSQPLVVKAGRAEWLPIAASHEQDAALYMNVRHVHVKLNPADAERTAHANGLRLADVNGQTGYVFVSSEDAGRTDLQADLDAAVLRALRRHLGDPPSTGLLRPAAVCPTTGLELPANGYCDEHEGTCR
jgi:hypothetical protein